MDKFILGKDEFDKKFTYWSDEKLEPILSIPKGESRVLELQRNKVNELEKVLRVLGKFRLIKILDKLNTYRVYHD